MVNREENMGKNFRKRIRWILILLVVISIFFAILLVPVYMPTLATVSRVTINTTEHYVSDEKLHSYLDICGINSKIIWEKPSHDISKCIKEKNPLIEEVTFKYWDGMLSVDISEPHIIFAVKTENSIYYVSSDEKPFRIDLFDNLPSVSTTFYVPITATLTEDQIRGLYLLYTSVDCKELFRKRGMPEEVYIMGEYARVKYVKSDNEKIITLPLYDLMACSRLDKYWDKIWAVSGKYIDFTHRRIIVVKDTP